jgi:hypothetical protein
MLRPMFLAIVAAIRASGRKDNRCLLSRHDYQPVVDAIRPVEIPGRVADRRRACSWCGAMEDPVHEVMFKMGFGRNGRECDGSPDRPLGDPGLGLAGAAN